MSARSGQLVAADQGGSSDGDDELYAIGVHGAVASAEAAAVHRLEEGDEKG